MPKRKNEQDARCRILSSLLLGAAAVFGWASADSHHAIAANYIDEIGTIEGMVVEVFWSNPHVHYYVEVTVEGGDTELWDVESSNLISMERDGWTRETIEVGDRIRASGQLGRDGRRRLALDRQSVEVMKQ